MTGALSTSREAKGGRPDGGRFGSNGLVARGYRGRQGPEEQAEGGKTASAGRAVEAGGMEACLARKSKTGTREDNRVQRTVQLSVRVADGRKSQYTESEGDGSRKHSNSGTGFKIRR